MSLIPKHVAVLQAWATKVNAPGAVNFSEKCCMFLWDYVADVGRSEDCKLIIDATTLSNQTHVKLRLYQR